MRKFGWKIQKQTFMSRLIHEYPTGYISMCHRRGATYFIQFHPFFLDEGQPEVPEEKAESVPDQPLPEA